MLKDIPPYWFIHLSYLITYLRHKSKISIIHSVSSPSTMLYKQLLNKNLTNDQRSIAPEKRVSPRVLMVAPNAWRNRRLCPYTFLYLHPSEIWKAEKGQSIWTQGFRWYIKWPSDRWLANIKAQQYIHNFFFFKSSRTEQKDSFRILEGCYVPNLKSHPINCLKGTAQHLPKGTSIHQPFLRHP